MKKLILSLAICLLSLDLFAQSTNPLNYSGKMYVSSYEMLSTMRYISFEDHAVLSSEMTIPVTNVSTIVFDFENNEITTESGDKHHIKVLRTKKYTMTEGDWNVVLYIDFLDDDKQYELVWREYGNPYFLVINKTQNGIDIARINLSIKPSATSPENALLQMFGGYAL